MSEMCRDMKRVKLVVLLFLFLLSLYASTVTAAPISPSSDLTYLGAFKLPNLPSGYCWATFDGAGYNKGGMSFYPPHGSLLVMGGPGNVVATRRYVAEVSIPVPRIDSYANSGVIVWRGDDRSGQDPTHSSSQVMIKAIQIGGERYSSRSALRAALERGASPPNHCPLVRCFTWQARWIMTRGR